MRQSSQAGRHNLLFFAANLPSIRRCFESAVPVSLELHVRGPGCVNAQVVLQVLLEIRGDLPALRCFIRALGGGLGREARFLEDSAECVCQRVAPFARGFLSDALVQRVDLPEAGVLEESLLVVVRGDEAVACGSGVGGRSAPRVFGEASAVTAVVVASRAFEKASKPGRGGRCVHCVCGRERGSDGMGWPL